VGGTIYNNHTLVPLKELSLDSQRVKKLASKLHVHSINYAAKLFIPDVPFPALLSALVRIRFQVKPATLLIPINLFLFSFGGGVYGTRDQSGSLINVGSEFSLPPYFFLFPPISKPTIASLLNNEEGTLKNSYALSKQP
jgi:hypothetical protein